MYDHLNYARTGPGAARGITVLLGKVLSRSGGWVTVRLNNPSNELQFYPNPGDVWEVGQHVEITLASFDS